MVPRNAAGWAIAAVLMSACSVRVDALDAVVNDAGAHGNDGAVSAEDPHAAWGLLATRGTFSDRVRITFRAPTVGHPDGYTVLRDGVVIASLPADVTQHDDLTAAAGDVSAPHVTATQASRTDGVELRWTAAERHDGPVHGYSVLARYGGRVVPSTETAAGHRGAPGIEGYEYCREPCTAWSATETHDHHLDNAAPLALVDAGKARARATVVPSGAVRLLLVDAHGTPVSARYRVRARTDVGPGPASLSASGARAPGVLHVQWERADRNEHDRYAQLPGVTGHSWVDATATLGTRFYYRARVEAEGAASAVTTAIAVDTERPAIDVTVGDGHACALLDDQRVRCWGWNTGNSWSDGFADLPLSDTYRAVSAGFGICAIRAEDAFLRCLYSDSPADTGLSIFAPISVSVPFLQVSSAPNYNCGVRAEDGFVACGWVPDRIVRDDQRYRYVGTWGETRTCALTEADGSLVCWSTREVPWLPENIEGDGGYHMVDSGSPGVCAIRATDHRARCWTERYNTLSEEPMATVSVGMGHACGLTLDGMRPVCWSLDDEDSDPVTLDTRAYRAIDLGDSALCVVDGDGRVTCRGNNARGIAPYLPNPRPYVQVSGGASPCGLSEYGRLDCWSTPAFWEPLVDKATVPITIQEGVTVMTAGDRAVCAAGTDGEVRCWLAGGAELYRGPESIEDEQVAMAPRMPLMLAAYGDTACALPADGGRPVCWGEAGAALNAAIGDAPEPLTMIALGEAHLCTLDVVGTARCYGDNRYGQSSSEITQGVYASLSVGPSHTCALGAEDQRLWCWGVTYGTAVTHGAGAVPHPSFDRYTAMASAADGICAIRASDRRVLCWGGTRFPRAPSHATYSAISAGKHSMCALRESDRRVICWGNGHRGEHGAPVVVP